MKNQYFGDNRDLFKYDLILRVVKEIDSINHFMFIPMLTPDVPNNKSTKRDGEKRNRRNAKAGTKNPGLVNFLDEFKDKSKRDIKHLKNFFEKQDIEVTIYCGKNKHFSHEYREEYFKGIESELLSKSLIFVDPDNGLEIGRTREKHIRYKEVKKLYENMDEESALMIYQQFPHEDHRTYLDRRSVELKEKVAENLPIYISDNEITFFFLTRGETIRKQLAGIIRNYKEKYDELYVGGVS